MTTNERNALTSTARKLIYALVGLVMVEGYRLLGDRTKATAWMNWSLKVTA